MERGWVKSYRKIEDWEWYKKPLTAHLFQHLIRRANREPNRWQGYEIPAGCLVTSIANLSIQTGLTTKQVRTALEHLYSSEDIENITQKTANKKKANFTVLKVKNYELYQGDGKQRANEGQTSGKQRANEGQQTRSREVKNEEVKNIKTRGEWSSSEKTSVKTFVPCRETVEVITYWNERYSRQFRADTKNTDDQVRKLLQSGYTLDDMKKVIDYRADEVQKNPKASKWFTPVSIFRPENFARSFEWALSEEQNKPDLSAYEGHMF